MRILFLAWRDLAHPNAGGSEVVIDRLIRELQERGHEATLMCGGPIEERPYPVIQNGSTYSQYITAPFRYARQFRDVDVVVDVANGVPYLTPFWRRGPSVCILFHVHGNQWQRYFPKPVARVFASLEQRGIPSIYKDVPLVTISDSGAHELEILGVSPRNIHVLNLGVDLKDLDTIPAKSEDPLFISVGRLALNKRIDLLLDMWAEVGPQIGGRLLIIGDGPERERLAARVRDEPALRGAEILGRVSDERKAELMHEAWLLVHSAEREGWGLVILEAARCATPSIGFRVKGVKDAILHGKTGLLAKDEEAFTQAWLSLASDTERRSQLAAAAELRSQDFTWQRTIDTFVEAVEASGTKTVHDPLAEGPSKGIARSVHLFSLFRKETQEPDHFYHYLAADTVRSIERHADVRGSLTLDVGGGPGYVAEALRHAGADCIVVDYSAEELALHGRSATGAVQGDAQALPFKTGSARVIHCSNVLEHVPNWHALLEEIVRVLEPRAGIGYLSFTPWLSPWGGHETSPWHYLGGERAAKRFQRKTGKAPKNRFGESLHRVKAADVIAWFNSRPDIEVFDVRPRYLPNWLGWIARIPGIREVFAWNLVIVFRRRAVEKKTSSAGS
jgi:glycosyltransferase involved in cell wall biosynthesis/SAM-dependent methyltransferase